MPSSDGKPTWGEPTPSWWESANAWTTVTTGSANITVDVTIPSPIPATRVPLPIPIADVDGMKATLKTYLKFLEDLGEIEAKQVDIVNDVIFGLKEALEALEKLG